MESPGPNFIVPTAPAGDSSNRSASTEFVTNAVASAVVTGLVSTSQVDFLAGGVSSPTNKSWRIVEYVVFPMTLNMWAAKMSAGSITAFLMVNAATVTGSNLNALSTTQITATFTAANTATTGDVIILTVNGTASTPADLSFAIRYTRTLATS